MIVTSAAISSTHWAIVRTLWPASSPASQSTPTRRSTNAVPAGVGRSGQQDQDIDVGVREELAAAVAADGHQRGVGGRAEVGPDAGERAVDQPRVPAQEPGRVRARAERGPQRRATGAELVAPALRDAAAQSPTDESAAVASAFMASAPASGSVRARAAAPPATG